MKTIAQRMTKRMEAEGRRRSKDSIYAVVSDEHNVHCLTESHLDVWWASLKPEDKAALYELHLDGILDDELEARPDYLTLRGQLVASAIVEGFFEATGVAIALARESSHA
jgi:hypothetical protein